MEVEKIIKKLEEALALLKAQSPEQINSEVSSEDQAVVFEELKKLLNSDAWPQAAPDFLICEETEKDKLERADGIISYLGIDFKDKKFLDFGCGEGHVAQKVAELNAIKSVGYDINSSGPLSWEQDSEKFLLTTDLEKVKANGPYDYVLFYDVLDHCDDPSALLSIVYDLITDKSKVFVRCHPVCARHSTHQYRKLNKAFIQLVFTDEEIKQLGLESDIKQKTYFPVADNNKWFQKAKFKVVSHDSVKSQVEDFFRSNKLVHSRIMRNPYNKHFPEHQMQQIFNDYILTKIV